METTKTKEDCKDLRTDVTDLRDKINDLDKRVCLSAQPHRRRFHQKYVLKDNTVKIVMPMKLD